MGWRARRTWRCWPRFEKVWRRLRTGELPRAAAPPAQRDACLAPQRARVRIARVGLPDPIGRFGIISHFRYALVPPDLVGAKRWHLSLNVTFDGGWEPYMRVIYRDIGPLLDALLCHCEGYPGSRSSNFDTYCRWVRAAELDAGIYYTDSPVTLADQRYLASVERLQRESGNPARPSARSLPTPSRTISPP